MERVAYEIDGGKLLIRNLHPFGVVSGIKLRLNCKATFGSGIGNQVYHDFMTDQRLPSPAHGDVRKQAMFNLIPGGK